MNIITNTKIKSVKSINLCKSVIQTIYAILKAHAGELNVNTKEGEGSELTIQLPVDLNHDGK